MTRRNLLVAVIVIVVLGAAFLLSGGASTFTPKATPTPSADLNELDNLITASGTLLPVQRAGLSFKVQGQVLQVVVHAGDKVKKGDALVRLDAADARAAVAIAQAQLDLVKAGATKEEVAASQATLQVAQAQLAKVRAGPTMEDLVMAKATLERSQSALKDAQSAYDKVKDDPAVGMYPQSQVLETAVQQYKIAEASYAKVLKGAAPEDIRIAEANVTAAQANVDRVKAGARAEEVTAAQARLEQASTALAAMTLTAPFDGLVAAVNVKEGEMATPGVTVITLGDVTHLQLETDDLSESNIARVTLGQPVRVTFEALSGKSFQGKVVQIASISTPKQGGTNYTVTVEFEKLDPVLRWGMTGHIEINTK